MPGITPDYRKGFAYVWGIASAFERAGRFDRTPKVGSFVCFNWNGAGAARTSNSHIGVVEQVVGDGTVVTLEGNVDDQIARKRRSMQFIEGFCHPPYEDTQEDDDMFSENDRKTLAELQMALLDPESGIIKRLERGEYNDTATNEAVGRLEVAIRDQVSGIEADINAIKAKLGA